MTPVKPAVFLRQLFDHAVAAAQPGRHLVDHLPPPPRAPGRTIVVGAGKATAGMAEALEAARGGEVIGTIAIPEGTPCECRAIECLVSSHPVPDERSVAAARRMRERVTGLTANDQVIALISGGGSALLCDPVEGFSLEDKRALTGALLKSGATIREINCVRQAVSRIKGGRLAALAAPAPVYTLLVSDVPGDDPATIASGPTVASPFQAGDAARVLERYGVPVPDALRTAEREDPLPSATELGDRCHHAIVCSPMHSLEAAAATAREHGVTPLILGDALEGEAADMGTICAGIARSVALHGQPVAPPAVLLSGGESSVTISGPAGRGGRNTELALAMAVALAGHDRVHAIACDTDGIDGSERNAGALIGPGTLERGRAAGLDPLQYLAGHDAYTYFESLDDLVITGPTGTNVNDFRAILIEAASTTGVDRG
ncbi:glycerate kinase type-2 family protein [Halofilum ochraceum]|uniref:glycerate kinase type-2 family protein n=1 Tax=Halofilum ochraceum TaxID=1611323 RepID=UPI0008300ABC|nr:glycerate kinase [Halofilum ochraceum]